MSTFRGADTARTTPQILDVASLLSLLGAAVDAEVLAAVASRGLRGLRVTHGYVVQCLLDGPRTATEIALELGVSQQAVSTWVRELVAGGYLIQGTDDHDRRRRPVELTARARQAVAVAREARAELEQRLAERVTPDDLAVTRTVLSVAMELLGITDAATVRRVPPPHTVR